MVVDSSAIVAILRVEAGFQDFAAALERVEEPLMSAGTLVELGVVLSHREGKPLLDDLFEMIRLSRMKIVPVSEDQAHEAIQAYAKFGKASGHRAKLNFGDCFSYALAKTRNEPLLYKGDDFSRTDIRSAL